MLKRNQNTSFRRNRVHPDTIQNLRGRNPNIIFVRNNDNDQVRNGSSQAHEVWLDRRINMERDEKKISPHKDNVPHFNTNIRLVSE